MASIKRAVTTYPLRVGQATTIQEVTARLEGNDIGDVHFTGEDGSPTGIVTDSDIVMRCLAEGCRHPSGLRMT